MGVLDSIAVDSVNGNEEEVEKQLKLDIEI